MSKIEKTKANYIIDYIKQIDNEFLYYENSSELCINENSMFDLLIEIIKVLKNDVPNLEDCALFRSGTAFQDGKTVKAMLKKYLIDNGYDYTEKGLTTIEKFWISYKTFLENELPYSDIIKKEYVGYDNWNNGTYFLDIDYNYQYRLHYGQQFDENNMNNIKEIKLFIELSFNEWIKSDKRYEYTKQVNAIFRKFKLPYKLLRGKVVSQGYKTTTFNDKIINYKMLERKMNFAEEMIMSSELIDKKAALDYVVDSLQYLISIQKGKSKSDKIKNAALLICEEENSKKYTVIKNEIDETMKIANQFFDIRHNEYFNDKKEIREPIDDLIFVEYLYNRVYSLVYIIKSKTIITL